MLPINRKYLILLILPVMVATVSLLSCSEEPTESEAEAPQIPPLSTFLMDFSDFPAESKGAAGDRSATGLLSQDNYNWAAVHVGVWNLLITVGLAVPVATFVESFSHQPVQQPDGSWTWSYDLTVNGDRYFAALNGSIDNFGTQWEMAITKEGEYEDFIWYTGEADLFLTEGMWILNKNPEERIPLVRIDWSRSIADSTAEITYTNIEPGGEENGGYISYGTTSDVMYDAFYIIYNKGEDNLVNIEWHRTSKDGRVKDPGHFPEDDWYCWDGDRQDIDCP
jgi:hypothetical protein